MQYSKGYLLGRLLVRLGQHSTLEATPEQVYSQAITTPPLVFSKALALLIEAGKEEHVRDIMKLLPTNTFDTGGLNWRERGAFALGYSHERAGDITLLEDDTENASQEGGELTDRYEFRIDPSLKEWIKTNGGGPFARAILRAEQTKQGHEDVTTQTS